MNDADIAEADAFIRAVHVEDPRLGDPEPRLRAVWAEIQATGTYRHTGTELEWGARMAWRNNNRCIGRLYWRSLIVRDCREVDTAQGVVDECVEHLRLATNGGKIRPIITMFAPDAPGRPGLRIRNDQLIRYAGYRMPDGPAFGDPAQISMTGDAEKLGWRGLGTYFDVLPLMIDSPVGPTYWQELPKDAVLEVPLTHPTLYWFPTLRLRWHAVPAISNMDMHIGGITYGAAPFNGWYMGTEIGARNLADVDRYNLLPTIAHMMGLDTSSDRTLWRDRALIELNVAVLHSFAEAGVTMTDHHTEAARFMTHLDREERAGREVSGDWSWLVPPLSGAQTPVFHRYYDNTEACPAFTPRDAGCPGHRREAC